jgi:Subtilase family
MERPTFTRFFAGAFALCLSIALVPSIATAAAEPDGMPSPSTFRVDSLCATPTPGRSGCLGLRLVPDRPLAVPDSRALAQPTPRPHATIPTPDAEASAGEAASEVVPTGEAIEHKAPIAGSLAPGDMLAAYGLAGVKSPSTQTIALVDAYDDDEAEADLRIYDEHFDLPACTSANGCFTKVNENGADFPLPASSGVEERGWAQEIATDVEVAHGVCQSCRILLVEAESNANADLYAAEQTAVRLGANEVSNSWGGEEPAQAEAAAIDSESFDHPGTVLTASAGDNGYLDWLTGERAQAADYPASSPHVIAVGGTRLTTDEQTGAWQGETVWNDGGARRTLHGFRLEGWGAAGGGCSAAFPAASWQQNVSDWSSVGCSSRRAVADVSADADPWTGVAVYDSTETPEGEKGWAKIGGTSVASPIIAAAYALAGGARGVAYPAQTLYENEALSPGSLHDVGSGSNGECLKPVDEATGASSCTATEAAKSCDEQAVCLAQTGYDGPSGVGTPAGINAFLPPSEHTSEGTVTRREPVEPSGSGEAQPPPGSSDPGSLAPSTRTPAGTSATTPPAAAGHISPAISALRLTRAASAATAHGPTKLAKLAFTFALTSPARVRVTLTMLVRAHGRERWRTIFAPGAFLAHVGAQTRALNGSTMLAPGRYRLTLAPLGGAARTITFTVR